MDELGALVLDPTDPFPKRRFYPSLDRVDLVPGHSFLPLHLGVVEAPRLHGRGRGSALPLAASARRRVWRRCQVAVCGGEYDPAVHDLQLPIEAGGSVRPETALEIGHGTEKEKTEGVFKLFLQSDLEGLGFWGSVRGGGGKSEFSNAFGRTGISCWMEM